MRKVWVDNTGGWRKRFALLPILLSDGPNRELLWLRWVWKRDMALYTEVSSTNPFAGAPDEHFAGDNAHLIGCIRALVDISDGGGLVPNKLGGHARTLLVAAAARLEKVNG